MPTLPESLLIAAAGGLAGWLAASGKLADWIRSRKSGESATRISTLLAGHFQGVRFERLCVSERRFPHRVRADLYRAVEAMLDRESPPLYFSGVQKEHNYETLAFPLLFVDGYSPAVAVPPEFEEIDVGDEQPARCLKSGLWLLERNGVRCAVLCSTAVRHGVESGVQFQFAAPNEPAGLQAAAEFFARLEAAVAQAGSYRGKVLSLEQEQSYLGRASGVAVHRLRTIAADEVILPRRTLELLQRNVLKFVEQRPRLAELGQATKKGLLFYGPPGTGKTHTIHYLAGALRGHTTLLVTADQVGLLTEYMALARLLQPSVVVMEDVDLIARDRNAMGVCEEVILNKLLNEMDGLRPQADVLFILTTNRPKTLEAALAARPGRIDQAIEFPLPDEEGRAKLLRLYAGGAPLTQELAHAVVQRTEGVSAAFIKELMRRTAQFYIERGGQGPLEVRDVDDALDEMLFKGGTLNAELLGAAGRPNPG